MTVTMHSLILSLVLVSKLQNADELNEEPITCTSKPTLVSRINFEDFNNMPPLGDAWNAVAKSNSTKPKENDAVCDLLTDTVGTILVDHSVHTDLGVVLNHIHHTLAAGENRVIFGPQKIKLTGSLPSDVFIEQYLAEPTTLDVEKDKLIPFKWRLNTKTGDFESYEYLVRTIKNADKYRQIALSFEGNVDLQQNIKSAIVQTGLEQYLGIMIQYIPPNGKAIESNWGQSRQSKMTVFYGDNTKFNQSRLYQELTQFPATLTGWEFHKLDNGKNSGESNLACRAFCPCLDTSHTGSKP